MNNAVSTSRPRPRFYVLKTVCGYAVVNSVTLERTRAPLSLAAAKRILKALSR